jgi:glycosyltransferase involved in cell wall biosynthesis
LGQGSSNGVDADEWDRRFARTSRDAVRAQWQMEPDDLVVGFVGRITPDKGVEDLFAAFGSLADLPLVLLLVGGVEDEALRPLISGHGDRVVHVDWTPDLSPAYVAMDVLCLPTRREGFPNVVLEAALAGVPTITTTATGARDSVVPGTTGWLIETRNVQQLAEALRTCVEDRPLMRKAGRAARDRALLSFRPQVIWSGLQAVYLDGGPRRAPEVPLPVES